MRAPRGAAQRVFQVVGFLVGLGLLAGCGYLAFSRAETREQLMRLPEQPWWKLGVLFALSGATIALSGLTFWALFLPIRRMRALDLVALNGVCSALSYLPFKVSLVVRFVVHMRRDGLKFFTIGAWMAATAALMLVSLAPAVAASRLHERIGAWWIALAVAGAAVTAVCLWGVCRFLASARGWALLMAAADVPRIGVVSRLARTDAAERLHEATRMLASPRAVGLAMLTRVLEMSCQAGRFYLAAMMVGTPVAPDAAILLGISYFVLQAATPTGVAGAREAGVAAFAYAIGLSEQSLLAVVLVVTVGEMCMNLVMGAVGAVWLRVDRLGLTAARR